ncbi:MAG: P-II family nitrogen regulator [Chloroflexi bacterium]|nr:P-II family nitrogen regulator [Chloroflexota bacterium]
MISIEAIVRPERVPDVTQAMEHAGCQGFYYVNVTGEGRQRGVEVFVGRGGQMARRHSVPKTLIRTVVPDEMKDAVIAAIIEAARGAGEGEIGDGKIFVTQVLDAVRVRTGERGEAAI